MRIYSNLAGFQRETDESLWRAGGCRMKPAEEKRARRPMNAALRIAPMSPARRPAQTPGAHSKTDNPAADSPTTLDNCLKFAPIFEIFAYLHIISESMRINCAFSLGFRQPIGLRFLTAGLLGFRLSRGSGPRGGAGPANSGRYTAGQNPGRALRRSGRATLRSARGTTTRHKVEREWEHGR